MDAPSAEAFVTREVELLNVPHSATERLGLEVDLVLSHKIGFLDVVQLFRIRRERFAINKRKMPLESGVSLRVTALLY
jgi:hypothetical protein